MGPNDVSQIKDFIGARVSVQKKDGSIVFGTLSFYNWEQQVIHLCDFEVVMENCVSRKGKFVVINSREWKNLEIGGETE